MCHAIREQFRHQLRHPGRALDSKTKDLIGHLYVSLIIDQSEWLVCFFFFALFSKKTALLLTNQNGDIFSCIFLAGKQFLSPEFAFPLKVSTKNTDWQLS